MSEETGRQSKTLVRGLSSSSRSGLTLVELADTTDFAPSTVHMMKRRHFYQSITKLVAGELVFLAFGW